MEHLQSTESSSYNKMYSQESPELSLYMNKYKW